jgi:hypothetical protein
MSETRFTSSRCRFGRASLTAPTSTRKNPLKHKVTYSLGNLVFEVV